MSSENKMGVMPINKLILSMSIPMMLSMLIQALYNLWTACSWPSSAPTGL